MTTWPDGPDIENRRRARRREQTQSEPDIENRRRVSDTDTYPHIHTAADTARRRDAYIQRCSYAQIYTPNQIDAHDANTANTDTCARDNHYSHTWLQTQDMGGRRSSVPPHMCRDTSRHTCTQ